MATWQFDFHLIPTAAVIRHYGTTPLTMARDVFENQSWWEETHIARQLRDEMAKLLPPLESWNEDIEQWGYDEGDRVDLTVYGGDLVEALVRVDVRSISQIWLMKLLDVCREYDLLLRMQDGRVIRPSLSKLLRLIHASDAFRFVRDPQAFLRTLKETHGDENGNSK